MLCRHFYKLFTSVRLCVCEYFILVFWPPCTLWFVSRCVINCHLDFVWLLMFQGWVWVCVCLGMYSILVSPRFLCAVKFAVSGSLIAICVWLDSRFMCGCAQVSCSVVSNWPCVICLWTCVLWYLVYIFLIPQFCLFLRHQTMDKVQKHNSFKGTLYLLKLLCTFHHYQSLNHTMVMYWLQIILY
jgi:hypothetical protein